MSSLAWIDIAEHLGVTVEELKRLRQDVHAPTGKSMAAWVAYVGKFERPSDSNLPGDNPYDKVVHGGETSYSEALVREKVREQMIVNERRQVELDQQIGKLITAAQYDAGLLQQQDAFLAGLAQLTEYASEDFLPGEKPGIRKKARRWINRIRQAVDNEIGH